MAWPSVCVVGPGGVGAFFGGMLARAGAPVTFLGRPVPPGEHLGAIARDGLLLRRRDGDERIGVETSTRPESVGRSDLVLFCVKSVDTDEAAGQIAPHLRPETVVADLQNGVDNPERMRRQGIDPVIAAVYVAAAVESPGTVTHRGRGDLVIGHPKRPELADRVKAWLEPAQIPCKISEQVETELWQKLVLNSMANAISALTDRSYAELASNPPTWDLAVEVAREASAVARALGHAIDAEEVTRVGLEVCRNVGAATSSTQQDLARGRPTEIDSLNGYVARRGAELGIRTPINHALWALVKLRESRPTAN